MIRKVEEKNRKTAHKFRERVKELNYLYGLSKLIEKQDVPLVEIFQGAVNLVPPAWQYPDITCARIVFENKEYKTDNFKVTGWKQSADIMVQGKKTGVVEVYYLEEKPEIDEGPFLKEERSLINAVAERLGKTSEHKKTEEALKKAYMELREKEISLIQSEKLAALGRFSSGIAHEIKNPLGIVLGGVEFLEQKLSRADAETKSDIKMIKDAVLKTDGIVQHLLKFGRPSELKIEKINPDSLINDTLSLLKYRAPLSNIEIITQFTKEEIYIEVDKNQMEQVLFNLLMNAVEAMPKGGKLEVKTYKTALSEFSLDELVCIIEIIDTGIGISKDDLPRLFEPFFTTKKDSKGIGLGLCTAKMIVENHKGNLVIESELKKGTDVKIILSVT